MEYWDPICSYTDITTYDYETECRAYFEVYGDGDPRELIHNLVLKKSTWSNAEVGVDVSWDDDHECSFIIDHVLSIQRHGNCYSIVADVVMDQRVTVWESEYDGNHDDDPELDTDDFYKLYISFGRDGGDWRGCGFFGNNDYGIDWDMVKEDHDTIEIWN